MATWVSTPNDTKFIEPTEYTIENVQYFCHHLKQLKNSQQSKALKFIEFDCIRYVGDMGEFRDKYSFIVLPLNTKDHVIYEGVRFNKKPFDVDYNSRVYTIAKSYDLEQTFECNCQAYQTKKKKGELREGEANCSHVGSLYVAFKLRKFNQKKEMMEDGRTP